MKPVMPKGHNLASQIIGSFEDIGKEVVTELSSVPKDITGKALESLGVAQSKVTSGKITTGTAGGKSDQSGESKDSWDSIEQLKDQRAKESVARTALEALLDRSKPKNQPSVWEKMQQEAEQKKEIAKKNAQAGRMQLTQSKSKRPRGDLYGIKAKKGSAEMSRNVRQD